MMNISTNDSHIYMQLADTLKTVSRSCDHVTKVFYCHGSPSSYLIHSLGFSFIINPSSIILRIFTLSQACAGAINITMCVIVTKKVCVLVCFFMCCGN